MQARNGMQAMELNCTVCGHPVEPWQPSVHGYQFALGSEGEPVKTVTHKNPADHEPTQKPDNKMTIEEKK